MKRQQRIESKPPGKDPRGRTAVGAVILAAVFVMSAFTPALSTQRRSTAAPTAVASPGVAAQESTEDDLLKTAKELSGDAGIVKGLTGGATRGSVIAMVVFSVIGIGYLSYGKKTRQLAMVICGIALMAYPYFLDGTISVVLVGLGLSLLPFVLGRWQGGRF